MKFIKKLLILLLVALVIIITVITLNGYKLYQLSIEKISLNDMVYSKQSDDNFVKIVVKNKVTGDDLCVIEAEFS